MSKKNTPFILNTYELPRRAGELKEYELDIEAPTRIGVPLIAVPEGDVIEADIRLESVTEGVLLSAEIYAVAFGECIRCLDTVEVVIDRKIQELYRYEPTNEKGRKKKRDDEDIDLDIDDELQMEGDLMLRGVLGALPRLRGEVGEPARGPRSRNHRCAVVGP